MPRTHAHPHTRLQEEDDAAEAEEVFLDDPGVSTDIGDVATKLHSYLQKVTSDEIADAYALHRRKWRFNISGITFVNESDNMANVFLAFVVTDTRPASGLFESLKGACCKGIDASDLRSVTRYTPAVR